MSLIFNDFYTVKRRYLIAFYNKPFSKSCIFPHNLEQRQTLVARGCVENYNAFYKTLQYLFAAYEECFIKCTVIFYTASSNEFLSLLEVVWTNTALRKRLAIKAKTLQYLFAVYEDKVFALYRKKTH